MIPTMLASFRLGSFAGLPWGVFGVLVGVVPLIVILATLSSVTKGRRRRGNGVGVVCLILMLGAMVLLLKVTRSQRHIRIDPPAISLVPSVTLEAPDPAPPPKTAAAGRKVLHSDAALDDRGLLTVSIDQGHGAGAVAVATRAERHLPRILRKLSPKVVWSVITACAIAALMFVGYIMLDAGTRGHFTWPLRVLSVLCFGAIITTVVALRHAL